MKLESTPRRAIHGPPAAGFTLLELLIALSSFAILMAALGVVFVSSMDMERDIAAQFECQQGAMMILGELEGRLREATKVELGAEGTSAQFVLPDGREVLYWHDAESGRVWRRIDEGAARVVDANDSPIQSFSVKVSDHLALVEIATTRKARPGQGVGRALVLRTQVKSRNGAF